MKKTLSLFLVLVMLLPLAACGQKPEQTSADPQQKEPVQTAEPEPTPSPELETSPEPVENLIVIDENTITVKDDGSGTASKDGGLDKTPVLTAKSIDYTGEVGSIVYTITDLQVSKLIATSSDTASFLDVEKGKEITLVAINMTVENTSDEDVAFYPYMSTIITNTKEQVESDWILSDDVGGDFFGNVEKSGTIFWICKKTVADDLEHFQLRIGAPTNSQFEKLGDDIKIEFELVKED